MSRSAKCSTESWPEMGSLKNSFQSAETNVLGRLAPIQVNELICLFKRILFPGQMWWSEIGIVDVRTEIKRLTYKEKVREIQRLSLQRERAPVQWLKEETQSEGREFNHPGTGYWMDIFTLIC